MRKTKETMVQEVKMCGQSLIDKAEEIVGYTELMYRMVIRIDLNPMDTELTTINVSRDFLPENYLLSDRKERNDD